MTAVTITQITPDELETLITDIVNSCLKWHFKEKENQNKTVNEQWLTVKELCLYHPDKPTVQTVYGWVHNKLIPAHKGTHKLRFKKSEIDNWLLNNCKAI